MRFIGSLSLFVVAILLSSPASSQFVREHKPEKTRPLHSGAPKVKRSFESDAEARSVFKQILDAAGLAGLEDRIALRASGDIGNAAAFVEGADRIIAYNAVFMQELRKKTKNYWSLVAVLAHEIGHHVRFHTEIHGRNHEFELEADYQAGFIMRRMGASREDAVAAFKTFPEKATETHPSRSDRLQAATLGWLRAGPSATTTANKDKEAEKQRLAEVERKRRADEAVRALEASRKREQEEKLALAAARARAVQARRDQERANPKRICYVNDVRPPDAWLALRTRPSGRRGRQVTRLLKGTSFEMLGDRSGVWVKVRAQGQVGWVSWQKQRWIRCG